jgi:hypothetical protein
MIDMVVLSLYEDNKTEEEILNIWDKNIHDFVKVMIKEAEEVGFIHITDDGLYEITDFGHRVAHEWL